MASKVTVFCNHDDYVWVSPNDSKLNLVPYAGKVIGKRSNLVKIRRDNGKEEEVNVNRILSVIGNDNSALETVDDMVTLSDLQEHTLLRNIQLRYYKDNIYTYIGWILIAVNPYKPLPIYSEKDIKLYESRKLGEPPHIYAIGAQAIYNLRLNNNNQCILISGETGAGKTESTKFLLNFIASVSCKDSSISNKIISSNPVLEAFGNAKTTENDNSSRFGKYIELYFKEGYIKGARVQHFLLEKSRVKYQNKGDKNYHIFYLLFAGLTPEEKSQLHFKPLSSYQYLIKGGDHLKSDRNEFQEFQKLKESLAELNFTQQEIWEIFRLLSVIIHMGNFQFSPVIKENNDATAVKKCDSFKAAVSLLGISDELLEDALTYKNIFVGRQHLKSYLTAEQACSNRDGFATTVYGRIFSFLLNKINKIIFNQESEKTSSIGILDIFGFENFTNNSFEQLCINYSNEFLQQFFVENVFKIEQSEYEKEDIAWKQLDYNDNKNTLNLLSLDKTSILNILDEQTKLPQGSDECFLVSSNQTYGKHPNYIAAKANSSLQFGVKHYAGNVVYNAKGIIEKNRNELSCEWQQVIETCSSDLMKILFANESESLYRRSNTLSQHYRKSLDGLMKALSEANPFFIRCLKPNLLKKPMIFDENFSCRQLQYFGFMDTVKIRKAGYPVRYTFSDFVKKYRSLLKDKKETPTQIPESDRKITLKICQKFIKDEEYRLGKSKVFLKTHHDLKLDDMRNNKYIVSATIIQRNFKKRVQLKKLKRQEEEMKAAIMIQRQWRIFSQRRAIMYLQAKIKSYNQVKIFNNIRNSIIHIQRCCRDYLKKKNIRMKEEKLDPKAISFEKNPAGIDEYINEIFKPVVYNKPVRNSQIKSNQVKINIENKFLSEKRIAKDIEPLSFSKFATMNFIGNVTYKFSNKPLQQPLLFHKAIGDCWAATTLWVIILRYTGDFPDPDSSDKSKTLSSMRHVLLTSLPKSYVNNKEYKQSLQACKEETNPINDQLMNLSLLHKSKLHKLQIDLRRGEIDSKSLKASYDEWLFSKHSTRLEKIHFIIGHGIYRPDLRDEIYCQLMKVVTENPNEVSKSRGWVLLSLCASCFAPSNRLTPTVKNFFSENNTNLFCWKRLHRTLENGTRTQPPTLLEIEAVKNKCDITLEVNLQDNTVLHIKSDSASTSEELCTLISENLEIIDKFGFSLFLNILDEELPMEAGKMHIMDGISQCEEYAREKKSSSQWRLEFRKQLFSPWQFITPAEDPASANQIYHQILKKIKKGQYKAGSDEELASVVAQHFHIFYKRVPFSDVNTCISNILNEMIPQPVLACNPQNYWIQLVKDELNKNFFIREKMPESHLKQNLAVYCKNAWPLLFSMLYDATQVGGASLGPSSILIAVNSEGIYFAKNSTEVLLKIPYLEILSCKTSDVKKVGALSHLSISTIFKTHFVFQTLYGSTIVQLVNYILSQLKKRSKYVLATEYFSPPDESFLELNEGDLVILDDVAKEKKWLRGKKYNGERGEFPAKSIVFLPTLRKPSKLVLEFHLNSIKNPEIEDKDQLHVEKYTLNNYLSKHSKLKVKDGKGYKFSKNLLSGPLHSDLSGKGEGLEATNMFSYLLQIMGDKISSKTVSYQTLLEIPLRNEKLRNEFYCQVLKQLTDNPNISSENKGWDVLWLAAGLFPCSQQLLPVIREFLLTRPSVISQEIFNRLGKTFELGCRSQLPHPIEIIAMNKKSIMQINICLPNGAQRRFTLDSSTTCNDLIEDVTGWLGVKFTHGFGLAVSFNGDVIFLPKDDFILDSYQTIIKSLISFHSRHRNRDISTEEEVNLLNKPKLHLLKLLWIYTIPGSDERADSICHYYQELKKYLGGVYRCSIEIAVELAAFILLAEGYNYDTELKQNLISNLSGYVPVHFQEKYDIREWIRKIGAVQDKCRALSKKKAREFFLKYLCKLELFGSAFFEIEEIGDNGQNTIMDLAVNSNGIHLLNQMDKRILRRIQYSKIQTCKQSEDKFILKLVNGDIFTWKTVCMPRSVYEVINAHFQKI